MLPENAANLKASLERRINAPPNNTVTKSHLAELSEARDYGAASSYNYLFVELMTIKHAVARGRAVVVESNPPETLESVDAFMAWALARFPAFSEPDYHDLYIDPVDLVWNEGKCKPGTAQDE